MDYVLCISNDKNVWTDIFDQSIIFNKLTDEHAFKLLLIQKIKPVALRKGIITIYLHDIELEELELHPKLYTILKYSGDQYGIVIKNIDSPEGLSNEEKLYIQEVNSHIHKEYLDKKAT